MGFLLALPGRLLFTLLWFGGLSATVATGALRWLNPMRYSIAAGLVLALLPPYVLSSNNSLLAGLFVLETTDRVMFFTAMSMVAALTVVGTFQAARLGGTNPEPQKLQEPSERTWAQISWMPAAVFLLLGLNAPACAGWMTWLEYPDQKEFENLSPDEYPYILHGSLCGIGIGIGLACLLGAVQGLVTGRRYALPGIMPFEFRTPWSFDLRSSDAKKRTTLDAVGAEAGAESGTSSGRITLGSLFFLLSVLYVVLMFLPHASPEQDEALLSARVVPGAASRIPAGFFALLLLSLATLIFAGAAFACDRRRIPTLLIIVFASIPAFCFPAADSYFALAPTDESKHPTADHSPPAWVSVYGDGGTTGGWKFPDLSRTKKPRPEEPQPTMVVVVAPGGGIQAAAWTTRVLTGLDEIYEDFSESVGFLSSVSGGSVGVMYYLVGRGDRENTLGGSMQITTTSRDRINARVRSSSLDAVAWALTYPKVVRPYRLIVPTDEDHGWALKTSWHLRLQNIVADEDLPNDNKFDDRLYLRGWCERIRRGKAPPFVFNATVIETGKRLTISPVTPVRKGDGEDFLTLYPTSAPHLATAARLSAAFPYISPSSRALPIVGQSEPNGFHIVDGGYADNEGILTAVEWVQELLEHRMQSRTDLPFKRILILRLEPFHASDEKEKPLWPLMSTLFGPAFAIANARGASQSERGDLEAQLLSLSAEARQEEAKEWELRNYEREITKQWDTLPESARAPLRSQYLSIKMAIAADKYLPSATSKSPARQAPIPPGAAPERSQPHWNTIKKNVAGQVRDYIIDNFNAQDQRGELKSQSLHGELKQKLDEAPQYKKLEPIPVYYVSISFKPDEKNYVEPMSWKLNPRQEKAIDKAWENVRNEIVDSSNPVPVDGEDAAERELKSPRQLSRFFKLR